MQIKMVTLLLVSALLLLLSCRKNEMRVLREEQLLPAMLRYRFYELDRQSHFENNDYSFSLADLDNDGINEVIEANNTEFGENGRGPFLQVRNNLVSVVARTPFTGRITFLGAADLTRNGRAELIVSEFSNADVIVHILAFHDGTFEELHQFTAVEKPEQLLFPEQGWTTGIEFQGLIDANGDGAADLIFSINTPNPYLPRGLFVYDFLNKRLVWRDDGGYYVTRVITADVTGDGLKEIIAGTSAPGNSQGHVEHGTDDDHSYLIILDSRTGTPVGHIKQISVKGTNVKPYVKRLSSDGPLRGFLSVRSFTSKNISNYIQSINVKNGALKSQLVSRKESLSENIAFIDGDDDGDLDLVYGWSDGLLEIAAYNADADRLQRIAGVTIPDMEFINIFTNHFLGDGTQQILCRGVIRGRYYVLLFSRRLKLLAASADVTSIGNIGSVQRDAFRGTAFLTSKPASEEMIGVRKQTAREYMTAWLDRNQHISYAVLMALMVMTGFMAVEERTRKSKLLHAALQAHQIPAFITNKSGLIIQANPLLKTISVTVKESGSATIASVFDDECWEECRQWLLGVLGRGTRSAQKEFSLLVDDIPRDFLVSVYTLLLSRIREDLLLVTIQELTEIVESKRALAWASMAQRLAHEIKTPLATVMLSAQRLETECGKSDEDRALQRKYIERILAQVERLRAMTDATLKFAQVEKPQLERVDINTLIADWIARNSSRLSREIELVTAFADELPHLMLDKQQISIMLQNVIENSLNAIAGQGVVTISTRLVQSLLNGNAVATRQIVEVEISDTGRGIPKEELKDLFKPFFTKSQGGTGLGLVIAKKIIEDHHGIISINSEVNLGTTVVIGFPVNGHNKGNVTA